MSARNLLVAVVKPIAAGSIAIERRGNTGVRPIMIVDCDHLHFRCYDVSAVAQCANLRWTSLTVAGYLLHIVLVVPGTSVAYLSPCGSCSMHSYLSMTNFESECARTVALAGCRPLALAVSKYFTAHLKYVHVH
jgi:hypothetical protein